MIDLDWDLLARYLARACTVAEREQVDRWLAASANRQALADLRTAIALADETAPPEREAAIRASLQRQWGTMISELTAEVTPETAPQVLSALSPKIRRSRPLHLVAGPVSPPRWIVVAKIAAAAALLAGGGLLAGRVMSRSSGIVAPVQVVPIAVSTARGERRVLWLSDGTLVALAPASTLRWSPNYGVADRVVELDGEAVFTVTHDATRPFAVLTPYAIARDLGTSFAVRAYPGDTATDVVVAEGIVAVTRGAASAVAGTPDSVVLRHGDRARVRPDGTVAMNQGVMLDDYFAWTAGRLVFRDTPFRDVVAQLSRWYGIDIRYDTAAIGDPRLSASFEGEDASEAVQVVAAILDLRVSRTGHFYTLRAQ